MQPLSDYDLEEKISRVTESIGHTDCKECKDATIHRLEARMAIFHRWKRRRENKAPENLVFHDAREAEYYPFGIKHHHNIHNTIRHGYIFSEKINEAPKELSKSVSQQSKRKNVVVTYLSQSHEDDLIGFRAKLREYAASKKQRISSDTQRSVYDYATRITDVDLATLKAHKECVTEPEADEQVEPTHAGESQPAESSNANTVDVPKEGEQIEAPVPVIVPTVAVSNPEEPIQEQVETSAPAVVASEPVASASPIADGASKEHSPYEPEKTDSCQIFGSSTLERLSFSMPVGNPLFAPKAFDASQFSIPKAPPTFVFGAQPVQNVDTVAPPQLQQPQGPLFASMPPPGPQFNIPGFTNVQLGQPTMNGPNTFAANTFPRPKRGMSRLRGRR